MRRILLFIVLSPLALSAQEPDCTILGVQDLSQVYQDLLDAHAELQQTVDSLQDVIQHPPCGAVVPFGGHGYETVMIGGQCWFAENLRTTVYADGAAIPDVADNADWAALNSGARCDYGGNAANVTAYGRLYNWHAVTDARGLCPSGWHVPTDGEWTDLETFIQGQGFTGAEGPTLKATSGWSNNGNGTDNFGFAAPPVGSRNGDDGEFVSVGFLGNWWTSTPYLDNAWRRGLFFLNPVIGRANGDPRFGYAVRCLRDAE